MTEFIAYPKTPRLYRDVVVTEKIDGTNAGIQIFEHPAGTSADEDCIFVPKGETIYKVAAQSRKRIITPDSDNFSFARWVYENAHGLVDTLGVGVHFGEWWGSGIQRGYGLVNGEKRFSLFNVKRWDGVDLMGVPGLYVAPVLYRGAMDTLAINAILNDLRERGSRAAHGFSRPEGIIIYHTASGQPFKVLLENDELPKGLVE